MSQTPAPHASTGFPGGVGQQISTAVCSCGMQWGHVCSWLHLECVWCNTETDRSGSTRNGAQARHGHNGSHQQTSQTQTSQTQQRLNSGQWTGGKLEGAPHANVSTCIPDDTSGCAFVAVMMFNHYIMTATVELITTL